MKTASPHLASALSFSDSRSGSNITIVTTKPHASSVLRMDAERCRDDERRADLHGLEQEIRATRIFLEISSSARGEPCANATRKLAELECSYRSLTEYFRTKSIPQTDYSSIPQHKLQLGRFSDDDT